MSPFNSPAEPASQLNRYMAYDFIAIAKHCLGQWRMILKYSLIAGAIGLFIAFCIPRQYDATAILASEDQSDLINGNLGSLASLAGVNIGTMLAGESITPELYPDIIESTPFVRDLFSVPVTFMDGKTVRQTDYYHYMWQYYKRPWWSYILILPMRVLSWAMQLTQTDTIPPAGQVEIMGMEEPIEFTREQNAVANLIGKNVKVVVNKKTQVVKITVTAQDRKVASYMCKVIVAQLQDYVIRYHSQKAQRDLLYMEKIYADAQANYYAAQQRYAHFVDANQGLILQSYKAESDRLKDDMELLYGVYNACAQQVQQVRALVQLNTSVFTVVSPPTTPLRAAKPHKFKLLIEFLLLGAFVALAKLIIIESRKD